MIINSQQAPKHLPLSCPLNTNRESVLEVLHDHSRLTKSLYPNTNLRTITETKDTTVFVEESHRSKITLVNVHHGVMEFVEQVLEQGIDSIIFGVLWTLAAADCVIHDKGSLKGRPIHLCFEGEVSEGQWCLEESVWVRGPVGLFSRFADVYEPKTNEVMALLDKVAAHEWLDV